MQISKHVNSLFRPGEHRGKNTAGTLPIVLRLFIFACVRIYTEWSRRNARSSAPRGRSLRHRLTSRTLQGDRCGERRDRETLIACARSLIITVGRRLSAGVASATLLRAGTVGAELVLSGRAPFTRVNRHRG